MEYHSEVALCLSRSAAERLGREAAALSFDDASLELLLHPDAELQDRQSGARFWHWEWVAWYQNRPGVEFIEKFLNGQDDDEYRFIRIGEDALDIEVRGILSGDPFSMALCTTIRFPELASGPGRAVFRFPGKPARSVPLAADQRGSLFSRWKTFQKKIKPRITRLWPFLSVFCLTT